MTPNPPEGQAESKNHERKERMSKLTIEAHEMEGSGGWWTVNVHERGNDYEANPVAMSGPLFRLSHMLETARFYAIGAVAKQGGGHA